jgi:small-conductance mechanosensitive channel
LSNLRRWLIALGAAAWSLTVAAAGATGASATAQAPSLPPTAPVIVDGRAIFSVSGGPSYPAERRAREIVERIDAIANDPTFDPVQLKVEPDKSGEGTSIFAGTQRLLVVLDNDAQAEGASRELVAEVYAIKIKEAVLAHRVERTPGFLLRSALYTAIATAVLVVFVWASRWLMRRALAATESRFQRKLEGLETRSFGMLDAEHIWSVIERAIRGIWWLVLLAASVAYVDFAFEAFPWTRHAARWLLGLVLDPLRILGSSFYESIPNLVFLAILVAIVRYLLQALRIFFVSIARGAIRPAGFEPEWAMTTYSLVRVGVIALSVVVAYPYIPGSGSEAFKGISVFVGVLFSLGASSIVSNTLAGYSLIYRKAFKLGDRVLVGTHLGDIVDIRQQVTILRTSKNETVVLPNTAILNSEIVNYSEMARKKRLILHSTVTIGYDTPWRQVEAMLLEAAGRTTGLLKDPAPFVLKTALDDFYVKYEINVYCDDASRMARLYSELHEHIVDAFNEHGVQIMSPHFIAQPDQAVLVPKDKWFEAPARRPAGNQDEASKG